MDSVEDYTRKGTKREKQEVGTFSDWVKAIRSFIQIRIEKTQKVNDHKSYICFQRSQCCNIHHKYVVVAADKAPNNIAKFVYLDSERQNQVWIAHRVILHIQLLRYQKRKSLIITWKFCLIVVFPHILHFICCKKMLQKETFILLL